MRYGNIDSPDIIDTTCEVVYDSGELSSTVASITITGLSGDLDKEYCLICRFVDSGGVGDYKLTFNTDVAANYGHQEMKGVNATASATRNTSTNYFGIGQTSTNAYYCFSDTVIYAKSGKIRTGLCKYSYDITGTTVTGIVERGYSWNNTVDNITQMVITPTANLIGIGSRIILLKKRELTSGTKTGEIDPQGTTYGHWQLIYDNTLTAAKTNMMLTNQMDSYTKLLIHADGADASTAFYDFSNSAHVITAVGTAQVDTAQSKFGGGSLLLDGNSDYLTVPDSSDWTFGTGDFTIDFWYRPNASDYTVPIVAQFADADNYWRVLIFSSNRLYFYGMIGGVSIGNYYTANPQTWTVGTWYHVAIVRNGSTCYMFKDGISLPVSEIAAWGNMSDVAGVLNIGNLSIDYLNGWLDEFRISKGIARWTANFTPPTRAYNELDGDRDCVYKLMTRGNSSSNTNNMGIKLNGDFGTNYGYQELYGSNATVGTLRGTSQNNGMLNAWNYGENISTLDFWELLLYAKSGFVRPSITSSVINISGTTVGSNQLIGQVWNNATDKINWLRFSSPMSSGLGIGTHVELWRLNL